VLGGEDLEHAGIVKGGGRRAFVAWGRVWRSLSLGHLSLSCSGQRLLLQAPRRVRGMIVEWGLLSEQGGGIHCQWRAFPSTRGPRQAPRAASRALRQYSRGIVREGATGPWPPLDGPRRLNASLLESLFWRPTATRSRSPE
jgi:hypothetical protein